jgi:exosortase C (VPDSG-CTERM-specific)
MMPALSARTEELSLRNHQLKKLAAVVFVLLACFWRPVYELGRCSLHSELYSYIPLIPAISLYLIWPNRDSIRWERRPAWGLAAVAAVLGVALLVAWKYTLQSGWKPHMDDYLAAMTLSLLCFIAAGSCAVLGKSTLRAIAFPMALLIFMVPFPVAVQDAIENFFQYTSAEAACLIYNMIGTPVFRDGLIIHTPAMSVRVAPECSGIHSSLVLFITSLLAGHLFLRSYWKRAFLTLFVIPLGIVRNGFRIFVVSRPSLIDSPVHHKGGPIFFVLSLIPFFILLMYLRKSERKTE